ncbi:signal peptidase I [Salinibaculum rarum]|uniref:signal peptidase I n=1 Tax=Salinibaculum rarum TaxID=3058903 RepID=UPI00265F5348|nr:signal peptidase I [Salinibaculum sp. KK48]
MSLRRYLRLAVTLAVVLVAVSLVAGNLLGQPILLSYVETGSMEPTMNAGDGFVAVPTALAGEVETGDVVTFRAEEIQGGGLTTHRIVEETERGYITRGDANPFADQDNEEPPVRSEQIVAVAWQPGGSVFTIPHLGTAIQTLQNTIQTLQVRLAGLFGTRSLLGLQGLTYLLLGATVLLYLVDLYLDDGEHRERDRGRDTGTSTRLLVAAMALGLALAATAAMAAPAGTQEYTIVSAEFESDSPFVIEQGTSMSTNYTVGNSGLLPIVTYLEPRGEGVDVQPRKLRIESQSLANTTMTLSAPPETGTYRRYVVEHRYLAVLPPAMIRTLYGVHPWLPVVAIDALIVVPFYLVGVGLLGTGRIRSRSREAPSRLTRLYSRYR